MKDSRFEFVVIVSLVSKTMTKRFFSEKKEKKKIKKKKKMEIPGFYYDAEKNRYFKIMKKQTNPDNPYTSQNIQERNKAKAKDKKKVSLLSLFFFLFLICSGKKFY